MPDAKEIVDKVLDYLKQGYLLSLRQIREHVYLIAWKRENGRRTYETLCDFAKNAELCYHVLDMLVDLGAITSEVMEYLKKNAADKLAKVRKRKKTSRESSDSESNIIVRRKGFLIKILIDCDARSEDNR